MGEPAGVGTEVLLKAYRHYAGLPSPERYAFFVIDDPFRLGELVRHCGLDLPIASIECPSDARDAFARGLPVLPLRAVDPAPLRNVKFGEPNTETAAMVLASIRQGVEAWRDGEAGGIVTLPIQKSVLQEAGFEHAGHTDFLGALTAEDPLPAGSARGPVMMLSARGFRTLPVTVHVPLTDVPKVLDSADIIRTARIAAEALRQDFGIASPVIAVCGLNPHAGEEGHIGREEIDVIAPAVAQLREMGIDAQGPFPADTLFHEEARRTYHACLGMYHDQALIPIKTLAFHEAVNVTLGLPIVRTSPDHGTALPIAGRGIARPDSTIAAIKLAAEMASMRLSRSDQGRA
jgi:4-hydroxythreonine-4-phosphate dehydrogenase